MKITAASHLDHGLTPDHVAWLLERFADRSSFFVETVRLPDDLPDLPCNLHGPLTGGEPVAEESVVYRQRGNREWTSRLVARDPVPSRLLTVIAGESEGVFVLWTAFGGPCSPREPGDTSLNDEQREESIAFWREHALGVGKDDEP